MKRSRWIFIDAAAVFFLMVALVGPWFRLKYLANWGSIESTFISDARFLQGNLPHPAWQPNWYCGTRWDYIYPPALRYGSALISKTLGVIPAKGYHIYTGLFYCLGIAGVYLLVRLGSGSRAGGWLAAAAAATLSPAVALMETYRREAQTTNWLPQRLNVLVTYGEGPHMTALAVLGLALAVAWFGLRKARPGALALTAALCALAVSNNFYGATALAMWFPILVWAVWLGEQDSRVWLRAAGVAALAYGLTAAWLTPSYFRVTIENLKLVSQPGNNWSRAVAAVTAAAFAWASWRWAKGRPERSWAVFVWGSLIFFSLNVLGNYYLSFRVVGEPLRLIPELDLVIILAAVELLRLLWRRPPVLRGAAVAATLAAFSCTWPYLSHAWTHFVRDIYFDRRVEYRVAEWLAKNMPASRVLVAGSVRFWYNAWYDLPQVGGGSEQGLLNGTVMAAMWEVIGGDNPQPSIEWLQCLGADAAIISDKESEEVYHDFVHSKKFDGRLDVLWDDNKGNRVYRIPRRWRTLARVVDRAGAERLHPPEGGEWQVVRAYVDLVEKGPDSPVDLRRESLTAIRLRARLEPGQSLLVQESYDPYWRAYLGSERLAVRKDAMGFMLIDAPPGEREIRLVFETPLENRVGRVVSGVSGLLVLGLMGIGIPRKEARS